jgi:hypothetical protein
MSRSERSRALAALAIAIAFLLAPARARADDDATTRARTEFVAATDHVKNARWGEALAAFERSAELRPHPLTTFNIGACERALGRYTRARATLERALTANEAGAKRELAPSFVADAKKWIADIDRLVVHAAVVVHPPDATLLVDGAPVQMANGRGALLLDPGTHVFSLSRAGFVNGIVNKTFAPGSSPEVVLDLQSLPATLRIAADRGGSVVAVDELDVGVAPVQLTRPAGTYSIVVRKPGFVTYQSQVKVGPGEEPAILATLPEETTPVTKKVWFWSVAAMVVAGAAVGTYFLTRPDPERPAPSGGALGWVVTVPAAR